MPLNLYRRAPAGVRGGPWRASCRRSGPSRRRRKDGPRALRPMGSGTAARLTKILKDAFDNKPKPKLVALPGGRV